MAGQDQVRPRSSDSRRHDGPIRVLIAIDKLGYEQATIHGAGRAVLDWTQAFDPSRVQVTTCVLRDVSGLRARLHEHLPGGGARVVFLSSRGRFNPMYIWEMLRLARRQDVDVLHLHGYGAATYGRVVGLLLGLPAIVHVHARYDRTSTYPRYVELLDRVLAHATARAVAISVPVFGFCLRRMGFRPGQVEVIPLALPVESRREVPQRQLERLRRRYGLSSATQVVGALTRFTEEKGTDLLIEAFAAVVRELPAARLLLVGDGPERRTLEARTRALGLEQHAIFAGFKEEPAAHLRLFDVTVVPSRDEGLGLTAIESLAAGIPVVATRVGGLPEVVEDGRTGLLVEPERSDALADAILRLLRDPALRRVLGAQGRVASRRFSMAEFLDRMEWLYRDVARPRALRRARQSAPLRPMPAR